MVLSKVIVDVIWWSLSVMEWPGGLKCKGTAAVALAWSGLFFACMFFTKRSRSVRLVSPLNILFLHLLHSIRNVKLVEVQVMRCFIRERFKEQATNNLPIPNWLTSLCILMPQMVPSFPSPSPVIHFFFCSCLSCVDEPREETLAAQASWGAVMGNPSALGDRYWIKVKLQLTGKSRWIF